MNNLILPRKTLKIAIAIAVTSLILYVSVLIFVSIRVQNKEDAYNSTESVSYKEEKIRVIKSLIENNKELIQTLQNFFVLKGDEVKFIEQIENIARIAKIKFIISSLDVKENQTDSFKEDVGVKMEIDGSWSNIMRFVDELEKMDFGVLIKNLNLNANTSGRWSGSVEFIVFREK